MMRGVRRQGGPRCHPGFGQIEPGDADLFVAAVERQMLLERPSKPFS
jgi:hypothetical protein